ncbi:DUF3618 domain-containing protein [Streptomyces sp. NPDC059009]|uniref:DUF3618 domain-containing protein n=1 Tax=Streptomyces sp. NPDC059009 TaxID=3346694 RepID=UPI00367FC0E1
MTKPTHDKSAATPEQLRDQVEQTRHELGRTVGDLAAKADVKARAQHKAAELKDQAGARTAEVTEQVRAKATEAAHVVQDKLPTPVKDTATATAHQVKVRADQAGHLWQDKAAEPVRHTAERGVTAARDHRGTLLVCGGVVVASWLLLRRRGGKGRDRQRR